jgi:hypothetical protein
VQDARGAGCVQNPSWDNPLALHASSRSPAISRCSLWQMTRDAANHHCCGSRAHLRPPLARPTAAVPISVWHHIPEPIVPNMARPTPTRWLVAAPQTAVRTDRVLELLERTAREHLCESGNQWQSMAINGNQWQPMATSGNEVLSMTINGNVWQSVALSGTQWQSVAISGTRVAITGRETFPHQGQGLGRVLVTMCCVLLLRPT